MPVHSFMMIIPKVILLLPDPPLGATFNDIKVAFYPPLVAAVSYLSGRACSNGSILVVALPCSEYVKENSPFEDLVDRLQDLLASVYTFLEMIFEEYTHQHETPRLDARNVLVYDPPRESDNSCPINLPFGTIPFAALAFSGALWAHIF